MRSLPLMFLATPALAHEGAHLHPHGIGVMPVLLTLVALIGLALAVTRR